MARNGHSIFTPQTGIPSRIMWSVNRVFTRAFHQLDVLALPHIPAAGPTILVSNHTSGLDPHLIQSCLKRLVTWMMAKEYYDVPVLRSMLDQLGVIPVTRSGRDMAATRAAMRALENGQLLGIFPEGKIAPTRELLPFQTGVALVALKTNARVFPVYLDGTQRATSMLEGFLQPHRASITFGPEVMFDRNNTSKDGLVAAATAMEQAVRALQQAAPKLREERGLAAGPAN